MPAAETALEVNTLTCIRGAIVLQLQRKGQAEPLLYEVQAVPAGFDLVRLDRGEVYSLRHGEDGWSCTCPSWYYRCRKETEPEKRLCKHLRSLAEHQLI